MYISYDEKNLIVAVSKHPFTNPSHVVMKVDLPEGSDHHKMVGKMIPVKQKTHDNLRVALICNWGDHCGIATYAGYLAKELEVKIKDLKIFSEITPVETTDGPNVVRCWKRGFSMKPLLDELENYKPDLVIVQHEFGIFPKATYFLQLLQGLESYNYFVVLHSVYEHLDKSICTAAIKNIVVHSQEAKDCLVGLGNNNKIKVIPHGCVQYPEHETTELWNIFQTPYALIQFGFGFFYKGVDKVLDSIHHLKTTQPEKYKDIFYCYLCSENAHTGVVHNQYYSHLMKKIDSLTLHDNVVIIRKYQTQQTINHYLRTAKLALFPYMTDPKNVVYGASGALRVAMANRIPVVASDSHMFDDLQGVIPRPGGHVELANEIDKVFSDHAHRQQIIDRQDKYITENTWSITAARYLDMYDEIL
jgi:glycosyltransferase involved in cell wall biosynthesis